MMAATRYGEYLDRLKHVPTYVSVLTAQAMTHAIAEVAKVRYPSLAPSASGWQEPVALPLLGDTGATKS
jgi:hypothetical protein